MNSLEHLSDAKMKSVDFLLIILENAHSIQDLYLLKEVLIANSTPMKLCW